MVDGLGDEDSAISDSPVGAQSSGTPAQSQGSRDTGAASTRSSTVVFGRAHAQAAGTASERRAPAQTPAEVAHMRIMLEAMEQQHAALAQQVRAIAGRATAAGGARDAATELRGDASVGGAGGHVHEGLLRGAVEIDSFAIALRDAACLGACLGCLGMGGAYGTCLGACLRCLAVGGAATEAVRGMAAVCGMHGACGAVGGATTEAVRGMAAVCGMVPQQGGTAADGAQAQGDMVADGAQAQGGVRITYFKVNTD